MHLISSVTAETQASTAFPSDGTLQVFEHDGTGWMWWKPSLLGWDSDVEWLVSPVSNEGGTGKRLAADLVGVDARGGLLFVENKPTDRPDDAFGDFWTEDPRRRLSDLWFDVARLSAFWLKQLGAERRWASDELARIESCTGACTERREGVLPYSSKRRPLHRWPAIYRELLGRVTSESYERRVLDRLRAADRPAPQVVGLYTLNTPGAEFPNVDMASVEKTLARFGRDKVHLCTVVGRSGNGRIMIEGRRYSWTIPNAGAGHRSELRGP